MADDFIRVNLAAFPDGGGRAALLALFGTGKFVSEDLLAYEAGYRKELCTKISIDIASFYNVYQHLRSQNLGSPFFENGPAPHLVIPYNIENLKHGNTYGVEVSANFEVMPRWKVGGGYSFLKMNMFDESAGPILATDSQGNNPQHQFQLRSYLNLTSKLELDGSLYYVSRLTSQGVPAYARVDLRFGWKPKENLEVSVSGQNLLDDRHLEYLGLDGSVPPTAVDRSVFAKLTWRF